VRILSGVESSRRQHNFLKSADSESRLPSSVLLPRGFSYITVSHLIFDDGCGNGLRTFPRQNE
jgi:hypothetical protein